MASISADPTQASLVEIGEEFEPDRSDRNLHKIEELNPFNATSAEMIELTPKVPLKSKSLFNPIAQPEPSRCSVISESTEFVSSMASLEWGGGESSGPLYPDSVLKWVKLKFKGKGPKLANHVSAFINDKMVIFGGHSEDKTADHIHLIDTGSVTLDRRHSNQCILCLNLLTLIHHQMHLLIAQKRLTVILQSR